MGVHRIMQPHEVLEPGSPLAIRGDEAQHAARVKRLTEGDTVEVLNGRGTVATARITRISKAGSEWSLDLTLESVDHRPAPTPRIEVWSSPPKGPRLEDMIDGLSQAGCAAWRPLLTERTIVDPREGKLARLERAAIESAKQCARPWIMQIGAPVRFDHAISTQADTTLLIADASGAHPANLRVPETGHVALLVGPEGGFSERELALASRVPRVRLGPHTMRIETAAVVGAALLVNALDQSPDEAGPA
jgi:16S rRNA (uracil1498-N3)-methyltransferase